MPWRLILFSIFLVLIIVFIGFNLGNTSDISFVFYKFSQVPVYMIVLISFAAGVIIMTPFSFGKRKKREIKKKEPKTSVPVVNPKENPSIIDE